MKRDRITELLEAAARHFEDTTVATPLCLHAKQCPPVKRRGAVRTPREAVG